MATHGGTICPYGESNPQALVERWAQNLNLVPESFMLSQVWVTVLILNIVRPFGTGVNIMVVEKDPAFVRTLATSIFLKFCQTIEFFLEQVSQMMISLPIQVLPSM